MLKTIFVNVIFSLFVIADNVPISFKISELNSRYFLTILVYMEFFFFFIKENFCNGN